MTMETRVMNEAIETIENLKKRIDLLDQENEKLSGEVASWRDRALKAENTACEHYSPERCGCLCELSSIEELAAYAHEAWSGWMKYMFGKCKPDTPTTTSGNGYWLHLRMPKALYERWTRQMGTDYEALPESEKDSDRDEAEKILNLMCSRKSK